MALIRPLVGFTVALDPSMTLDPGQCGGGGYNCLGLSQKTSLQDLRPTPSPLLLPSYLPPTHPAIPRVTQRQSNPPCIEMDKVTRIPLIFFWQICIRLNYNTQNVDISAHTYIDGGMYAVNINNGVVSM